MRLTSFVVAVAGSVAACSAFGQAQPTWRAMPGLDGEGRVLLVTSGAEAGGNGAPALWIGGNFTQVGGTAAGHAAKLVGGVWSSAGSFNYQVQALCEHDGGNGRRVYAGGSFSLGAPNGTAGCAGSFNGSSWSLLPGGYMLTWCNSLTSYQLPGQPAKLLVSGSPSGGSNYCRAIGPAGWEDVGGEFITVVDAARVYDDGSGVELFTANGTFNGVNKFNGVRRAMLGGNCLPAPQCMVVMGEGTSRRLIAGGPFTTVAGAQAAGVAAWNGTNWSGLGGAGWGVFKANGSAGTVHSAVLWDDGSGEKLWVGGQFAQVGGSTAALRSPASNLALWDGAAGSAPTSGGITGVPNNGSYRNGAEALAVYDFDGPGGRPASLVVAGQFTGAGGVTVSNFAVLDAAWCGPADLGRQGGIAKPDGRLDNNDFVAFIDLYFSGDERADVGVQGGAAGRDDALDNNDFVAFIEQFFGGQAGCNP